jgi:hypothetical protein
VGTKQFSNYESLLTFTRASGGHALRPVSYGTELVTNGTFDSDTSGWTAGNNAVLSVSSNRLRVGLNVTDFAYASQSFATEAGKIYFITFNSWGSNQPVLWRLGTSLTSNNVYQSASKSDDNFSWYLAFVAQSDTTFLTLYANSTSDTGYAEYDNISVKEVTFDQTDGTLTLFEHPNNVPRVEWDAQRNRLGLLVEEARTNSLTYSEDFKQSFYIKDANVTVTSSNNAAPSGALNASLITASDNGRIYANTASLTGVISVFVKAGTFTNLKIKSNNVDLVAKTASAGTLTEVGGGWFRYTSEEATASRHFQIQAYPDDTYSSHTTTGTYYIWGAQVEAGSFPTSYIKTTGATATRSADIADINTADFGYNSAEGTVVCEFNIKYDDGGSGFPRVWEIGNSSSSADRINVYIGEQYGTLSFGINTNTASVAGNNLKVGTGGSVQSTVAMGWAKDNVGVSDDGDSALTDSNADILPTAFSRNRLKIGGAANTASDNISGHIKSIKYYPRKLNPRKLTNAQIEDLSS